MKETSVSALIADYLTRDPLTPGSTKKALQERVEEAFGKGYTLTVGDFTDRTRVIIFEKEGDIPITVCVQRGEEEGWHQVSGYDPIMTQL